MIIFSKTETETITIENLKLTLKLGMSMKKFFNFDDILYIVEKVMKKAIQW